MTQRFQPLSIALCMFLMLLLATNAFQAVAADNLEPPSPSAQASMEARISQLILQLGDENFRARESARWELERIGLTAFGQLRDAVNHPNIQIASVARYLVQSQNVTWWLDTDSVDVRRLLKDYNMVEGIERDTRLQELSVLGTDDAMIALCRLARFESNEAQSKSAALYLMESLLENDATATLPRSILVTIGTANRPATHWLSTLASDLTNAEANIDLWRELTKQETLDVIKQSSIKNPASELNINQVDLSGIDPAELSRALRFYKWAGDWLRMRDQPQAAVDIVKESIALVEDKEHACLEFSHWAIAASMPDLIIALAADKPKHFEKQPSLGYLLAESHLRLGNTELAEELAGKASAEIAREAEKVRRIPTANVNDSIASRRLNIALVELSSRGLYKWAETELLLAIELATSPNIDSDAREMTAEFYWAGGQYQRAAEVLEPLVVERAHPEPELPGRGSRLEEVHSFYHFYSGLALAEQGKKDQANAQYMKSLEMFPNPDVVIAMQSIADEEPMRSYFDTQFEEMVSRFRVQVANKEHMLAESPDRMTRNTIGYTLSRDCNQLAWLLSKCRRSPEEAINLSLRSLEFNPGEPAYLDTLGRCYYSAGQYEEAVQTQQRAVDAMPYDRMMRQQLAEFQSALEQQRINAGKSP
ncbi:MAG: hypothetical protein R3C53_10465 [Pirellulaceae bacterium]